MPSSGFWDGYAGNPEHTALSSVASQPLDAIRWQTPVDLNPQYSGNDLLIHYGSPTITANNTVIVPVKTGASGGFQIEAMNGASGPGANGTSQVFQWTQATNYVLPPHDWTPSYSPALTPGGRLYYAGAGGTVYYITNLDSANITVSMPIAFYGNLGPNGYDLNTAAYNNSIFINTPLTSDSSGNIYFGFQVTGSNPLNIVGGIARLGTDGSFAWTSAATAANDSGIVKMVDNAAPALSNDGSTLYIAVNNGDGGIYNTGYLVALNSTTLAPLHRVQLFDPNGNLAYLPDDGSSSPTVGLDGDVYFGVLENPFPYNHDRGWLLHFDSTLTTTKTTGAFGWDDTASLVPASMVPSYTGTSTYLLMTKYNNYADVSGDGHNKIAILDPNATMTDPITGRTVMKEVETILGQTPDPNFPNSPGAVREWCINSAVVDPATDSVLANCEDGKLYRWNLASNTFTQVVTLTPGVGEAYTPTLIGPDGTVYAINNATLFALGSFSTTTTLTDNGPNPSTSAQTVSFTVSANGVNGEAVKLEDASNGYAVIGTGTIAGGTAIVTVSPGTLAAGTHLISAVYGPDTNYAGSRSSQISQVVLPPSVSSVAINAGTAPILSASESVSTVTIITDGPHGFTAGDPVVIAEVGSGYDGDYQIATVATNSFTINFGGTTGLTTVTNSGTATDTAFAGGLLVNGSSSATSQRSMVDSIVYKFNQPVNLGANAFAITATGQSGQAPSVIYSSPDGGTTWVVTFGGTGVTGNSIATGEYQIVLNASAVSAVAGGGKLASSDAETFYRLFGDTVGNGHQRVNGTDNNTFLGTFGLRSTAANFLAYLDFDGNGRINGIDNNSFLGDFGLTYQGFTATI